MQSRSAGEQRQTPLRLSSRTGRWLLGYCQQTRDWSWGWIHSPSFSLYSDCLLLTFSASVNAVWKISKGFAYMAHFALFTLPRKQVLLSHCINHCASPPNNLMTWQREGRGMTGFPPSMSLATRSWISAVSRQTLSPPMLPLAMWDTRGA